MKQWSLMLLFGLIALNLNAADLTPEQLEQQIQLSHMLGQISQKEQNYRIQKVRSLGVDGYYEWLRNHENSQDKAISKNSK